MPTSLPYRLAVRVAHGLLPLVARSGSKMATGHRGRTLANQPLERWAAESRDVSRPLVWMHAPSVGEGLQVAPVLDRLVRRHPGWQFAYTWYSPSAASLADTITADIAGYLPYDLPGQVSSLLEAMRPTALVFGKLDLWPELATQAARRGTRVGLIAGTVRPGSGRLRWPVRGLLAPGYRVLSGVGAISRGDAERLERLGVPASAIVVTGDTRYDSVLERIAHVRRDSPLLRSVAGQAPLVAGSTWPADEAVLLEAWGRVRARHPGAGLVLVPHEPTAHHLEQVDAAARARDLPRPLRLSDVESRGEAAQFLVVDRVGVLAALYGAGAMAYVGGGFGAAGLHSVLEPAAWGLPVMFGPRWTESRDAERLVEGGGGFALPARAAADALAARWCHWLDDESARQRAGAAARALVESGVGAADRSADLVTSLVEVQGAGVSGAPTTTPS